jgi:sugar phosphate isomerase/epimerase
VEVGNKLLPPPVESLVQALADREVAIDHPQTSVATPFNYDVPIEKQVRLVAEAGFSHISLGTLPEHSGYLEAQRRRELKGRIADLGLTMDTIHARPLHHPKALEDSAATLSAAADLGASFVVAHVGPFNCRVDGLDERLTLTLAVCNRLLPVVQETGVRLALENVMPGPATDLVRRALFDLDPAAFGLCYDSSHDQIDGPRPFDLIDEFRNRIYAVHLSDRIKAHVDHVIPGEGFIPWADMCLKLGTANYTGPILMEVLMAHSRFQVPTDFLREACSAALKTWEAVRGEGMRRNN